MSVERIEIAVKIAQQPTAPLDFLDAEEPDTQAMAQAAVLKELADNQARAAFEELLAAAQTTEEARTQPSAIDGKRSQNVEPEEAKSAETAAIQPPVITVEPIDNDSDSSSNSPEIDNIFWALHYTTTMGLAILAVSSILVLFAATGGLALFGIAAAAAVTTACVAGGGAGLGGAMSLFGLFGDRCFKDGDNSRNNLDLIKPQGPAFEK